MSCFCYHHILTPSLANSVSLRDLDSLRLSSNIVLPLYIYVSLRLRVQNAVFAQPCVGKLGISLVLLNFLDCNFRLWLETP